jgi:20S proteasome subunit beta 3
MQYNGGSVIAMVGKDCVAIASDLRLGNQGMGISSNFQRVNLNFILYFVPTSVIKVFPVTDRIYIGLPGLATDVATL